MHPVLFQIPMPGGRLPIFGLLLAAAVIAAAVAVWLLRERNRTGAAIAAVVAAAGLTAGLLLREAVWKVVSLPIQSYGVMLGLSFIVGWYVTLSLAEKDGLPKETMANCYVVTAVSALVGSRLLYVLTNLSRFDSFFDVAAVRGGGFVAYGGFLGGFAGSVIFLRAKRLPLLPWADVAVPSLGAGLFITRIGCYLFGCDFGKELSSGAPAWLRSLGTFPRWDESIGIVGAPAWVQHVNERGLSPLATHSLAVHPTQLYESAFGLALFVGLLLVRRWQTFRGQVFLIGTFAYGSGRYVLEIVRDDLERGALPFSAAAHVLYPAALALFTFAYAVAFAPSVSELRVRRATQLFALVMPLGAFAVLKPGPFEPSVPAQLSTSQLIALATAAAASIAYVAYRRAALANPGAAMRIELPPDAFGADEPESKAPSESRGQSIRVHAPKVRQPPSKAARDASSTAVVSRGKKKRRAGRA